MFFLNKYFKSSCDVCMKLVCITNILHYFVVGLGDTCSADGDCVAVTDSSCDETCTCDSGYIQDGTECKIGTSILKK